MRAIAPAEWWCRQLEAARAFEEEFWKSGNRWTKSKRARVSRRRLSRDGRLRVDAKLENAIARDGGRRAVVAMAVVTITLVASAFCLSGSALTVLNKQIMGFFPAPNAVLFAQNAVTLVLLAFGKSVLSLQIEPVQRHKAKRWFTLVLLFYAMLARHAGAQVRDGDDTHSAKKFRYGDDRHSGLFLFGHGADETKDFCDCRNVRGVAGVRVGRSGRGFEF